MLWLFFSLPTGGGYAGRARTKRPCPVDDEAPAVVVVDEGGFLLDEEVTLPDLLVFAPSSS
jgi:hypothetical protein